MNTFFAGKIFFTYYVLATSSVAAFDDFDNIERFKVIYVLFSFYRPKKAAFSLNRANGGVRIELNSTN